LSSRGGTAPGRGAIKAITERVSPRVFRVVALPAPTERETTQMYAQGYIQHLPAGGEVVIFDRSWYNRAGVERVIGFCTEEQAERLLEVVPHFEKLMIESGIILIKYWLEVSPGEETRRLAARIDDGRKIWKLSPMDLESYKRWYDYSRARDAMFETTDTGWAPWHVVRSDDKNAHASMWFRTCSAWFPMRECRGRRSNCPSASHLAGVRSRPMTSSLFRKDSEGLELAERSRHLKQSNWVQSMDSGSRCTMLRPWPVACSSSYGCQFRSAGGGHAGRGGAGCGLRLPLTEAWGAASDVR
jgi:hypothetical protein